MYVYIYLCVYIYIYICIYIFFLIFIFIHSTIDDASAQQLRAGTPKSLYV